MGNITEFENPLASRGLEIPTQGAAAWEQAGYHEARIAHQIEGDVNQTLGNFSEHEAMDQITDHNNKLQAFEERINGDGPGSWNEAKAKGIDANDFIKNTFQPGLDEVGNDVTNKRARFAAIATRNAVSTSYHNKLLSEQNQIDGDKAVTSAQDTINAGTKVLLANPAVIDAQLIADTAKVDSIPFLANKPPNERAKLRDSIAVAYATAAGDSWMEQAENPNATAEQIEHVKALINDPKGRINISAPLGKLQEWNLRLDKALGSSDNTRAEIGALAFHDGLAHMEQYGDGDHKVQDIIDAMPSRSSAQQVKRAEMQRQYDQAGGVYKTLSTSKDLSGADVGTKLDSLATEYKTAPPSEAGRVADEFKILSNYETQRQQAFRQSPADFVISTNPTVANAFKAFQAAPPEQKAKDFQVYAAASDAEKNRLYPGVSKDILPSPMKTQIGEAMSAINSSPNGAVQAASELNQLRDTTGPYWSQAVHELYHDKILLPGQYVAGAMMNDPGAASLASEALRAAAMPKADIDKLSNLSETQATKLARDAMADLADTFQGSSTDEVAAYQTTLAAMLRARSTGSHTMTDTDASYLASRMVLNAYSLQGGMRIPKSMDADAVVAGSKSVMGDIASHNLVLPAGSHGPMVEKDQYVHDVQNYGKWTTNQAGDGAILLDQQNVPVYEHVNPSFNYKSATGMKQAGNLVPWNRPILHNPDGSYSTTSSISIGTDKGETLIPTVVDGKRLSTADAIAHFKKTGENLGVFDTSAHADAFATALHNAQAKAGNAVPVEVKFADFAKLGKSASKPGGEPGEENIATYQSALGR